MAGSGREQRRNPKIRRKGDRGPIFFLEIIQPSLQSKIRNYCLHRLEKLQ